MDATCLFTNTASMIFLWNHPEHHARVAFKFAAVAILLAFFHLVHRLGELTTLLSDISVSMHSKHRLLRNRMSNSVWENH